MGYFLTGKLGRAWVREWVVHGVGAWMYGVWGVYPQPYGWY